MEYDFYAAAIISARAGYSKIAALRQMQQAARDFLVKNLRKLTGAKAPPVAVRLVLGQIEVFHMKMKTSMSRELKKPKSQTKRPDGRPRFPNRQES